MCFVGEEQITLRLKKQNQSKGYRIGSPFLFPLFQHGTFLKEGRKKREKKEKRKPFPSEAHGAVKVFWKNTT
jgi:hypothetical protein